MTAPRAPIFLCPEPPHVTRLADARHMGASRQATSIRSIILHATAGTNSLDWLTKTSEPPVSSHLLIAKSGTIYRLVPDTRIAFHAGYSQIGEELNLNPSSLGLELENRNTGSDLYPDAQLDACVQSVAYWWSLYGLLPILSHAQVDAHPDHDKTDPLGFPWPQFHRRLYAYCVGLAAGVPFAWRPTVERVRNELDGLLAASE